MRHAILTVLLGAALLAGCGGDDKTIKGTNPGSDDKTTTKATNPPSSPSASSARDRATEIKIVDFVYIPTPATIKAGQRIAVPNADKAPHTITDASSGDAFDSGTIKGKTTGSLTIDKPGSYRYICEFHPFMKGDISVTK